jgi:hypothetical protein
MRASGGSVARARLASESMIMFTHSICAEGGDQREEQKNGWRKHGDDE